MTDNGAAKFETEGLTLEQLRDLVLGGPNNFEIIRNVPQEQLKTDEGNWKSSKD